jgi:hypothetical protein
MVIGKAIVHGSNTSRVLVQEERARLEQLNTAAQELSSQRRLKMRELAQQWVRQAEEAEKQHKELRAFDTAPYDPSHAIPAREDDTRAAAVARAIDLREDLDSQVTQKQVLLWP